MNYLMIDEQSLGRNCQICSSRRKTLKFAAIAKICEFCECVMPTKHLQPYLLLSWS